MKILLLLLAPLFGAALGCEIPLDRPAPRSDAARPEQTGSLKDPVCGVTCIGDRCERETFRDKQYCFCSKECRSRFDENPERYLPKP
jgi:YHS domain-containing protein